MSGAISRRSGHYVTLKLFKVHTAKAYRQAGFVQPLTNTSFSGAHIQNTLVVTRTK